MSKVIWNSCSEVDLWSILKIGSSTFVYTPSLTHTHTHTRSLFLLRLLSSYQNAIYKEKGQSVWHGNWHDNNWTHNNKALFFPLKNFFFWAGNFSAFLFCCWCLLSLDIFIYAAACFMVGACVCVPVFWLLFRFVSFRLFCYLPTMIHCNITNFSNVYLISLEIRHHAFFALCVSVYTSEWR